MIPIPSGMRLWIATGHTDMRRGMNGLALQVQQALQRDPHAGDLFAFRGRRGNLIKILWHDGLGMSLYAKRLERGKFIWPSPPMVSSSSHRRSLSICWRVLTGDIRSGRGGQKLWADCTIVTHCTIAGLQAPRLVIPSLAMSATDSLPDDVETLQRLLRIRDAELGRVRAQALSAEALIAHLRLAIEKMRRELYGQRPERKARLLDQMELGLEELEAAAAEDEFAAGKAAATSDNTTAVRGFTRRKPSRKPFPAHLPRERVIVPGPTACACCGSTRLAKLGEDVTETLEVVPRQWKVVQYVREKFTCRACERISQAPAPLSCAAARLCRAKPLGHDPVREVRAASTTQSPSRPLCPRRRGFEFIDARRPGRRLRHGLTAAL